jgi:hypothetical protein
MMADQHANSTSGKQVTCKYKECDKRSVHWCRACDLAFCKGKGDMCWALYHDDLAQTLMEAAIKRIRSRRGLA